jgi:DNA polymerase III subunit chi
MGVVMFYHLTHSDLEETARTLLARSQKAGWRVMLRGVNPNRLKALDRFLWQGSDDDFFPHGLEGGPHDAAQPILLGQGAIINDAQALMTIEGAVIDPAETTHLERVFVLFDGRDEAAVAAARAQWKEITAAGLTAQYWSEASGQWEKKAG